MSKLIFFVFVFCLSCTYDKLESIQPVADCNTVIPETVSFNQDILPILSKNCSTVGCHSGKFPEGNLNLEASVAYTSLMKKGSGYVDTINPRTSVLYSALVSVSNPMPPNGKLDNCTIQMIERWMQQKAKNN